ncbi:MAG: hypothetical protein GF311_19610 [Candidatus Lokiarchaeota archaeon]|nr:hypothetical protein [Candidatus Lokiarchaeota archaeon]
MTKKDIMIDAERKTLQLIEHASSILQIEENAFYRKIEGICKYILRSNNSKTIYLSMFEKLFEFISAHVDTSIICSSDELKEAQILYNQLRKEVK